MLRKKLIVLVAICFIFMASGVSTAEVRYTITDLGTFSGNSYAKGLNDLGQVVGYSYLASGDYHAFRWDPNETNGTTGSIVDLGVLPGNALSSANGINNSGHIVGTSDDDAFIHDGTQMFTLSTAGISSDITIQTAVAVHFNYWAEWLGERWLSAVGPIPVRILNGPV